LKILLIQQIGDELRQAMTAKKCRWCGCFQDTVNTMRRSVLVSEVLGTLLDEARTLFEAKRYDCLGCEVCRPAVAQNLAAQTFRKNVAKLSCCAG